MNIYICRHGQTYWNAQGILQGQMQSKLNATGVEQAHELSSLAEKWCIDKILSSKLQRSKQTAEICAKHNKSSVDSFSAFNERNFGWWQGVERKKLTRFTSFRRRCYDNINLAPNLMGESTNDVRERFTKQLIDCARFYKGNKNLLLISHGDAIDCFLTGFTKPHRLTNCQYVHLHYVDNVFKVASTNSNLSKATLNF